MLSLPLDSTHSRTTSGVECHYHPWTTQTVERRKAWHDITALELHALPDDVGRCMPSSPLDSTDGRTTLGVAWHHHLWTTHTVELLRACHAITAFGQHTRFNDVSCGMPSMHLGSTHGLTTSGVACHHRHWAAQMAERRQTWHQIIAFGIAHTI